METVRVVCEMCNGRGWTVTPRIPCDRCDGRGWTQRARIFPLADGVAVVRAEAWEEAVRYIAQTPDDPICSAEAIVERVAAALLGPGVRVAEAVGQVTYGLGYNGTVSVNLVRTGSEDIMLDIAGRAVAILKPQEARDED